VNSYLELTDLIFANDLLVGQARVCAKKGVGGEKTNFGGKSKKGFVAVTLVTVLSILAVIAVYAVLIGTFNGGQVVVQGPSFSTNTIVTYSSDNATWTPTLSVSASGAWYARLEVAAGYTGPVTITWQLQQENPDKTWSNVNGATFGPTSVVFTGSAQYVYATSDGTIGSNYNWGSATTTGGAYRVSATVNSA
jgi:hypothetical protein